MSRILVVDDEPGMRQVISKILVPLGHEIIGTDEGARAINIMKEQGPDAVLLDIRLADMDSPEIIASLKKIKSNVPIIILSGFGDVEAAIELVKLGAFDYISKPFKVNDFTSLINKALSKGEPGKTALRTPSATQPGAQKPNETSTPLTAPKKSKNTTSMIFAGCDLVSGNWRIFYLENLP